MRKLVFPALIICYLAVIVPFTAQIRERSLAVKLGRMPEAEVIRLVAGEHRYLIAEYAVTKVLFYFGTLMEKQKNNITATPEYFGMFKTLETAIKLDPYNMDAYYFSQAAFTWEVGRAADVNSLLRYGMKYRTWDWYLPFFAGFNSAYFLKDYASAAIYMKKAAELSDNPLLTTLAARYFYESRQNDFAISFIDVMEQGARDKKVKEVYGLRKKALVAIKALSDSVQRYQSAQGSCPASLAELVSAGLITEIPPDPYGGVFYLDEKCMVRTTSKLAFGKGDK